MLSIAICFWACGKDDDTTDDTKTVISTDVDCATATYSAKIQPLVETRCNISGCHSAGSDNGDYTTYDLLKAQVDAGKIENRVLEEQDMPLGSALTSTELGEIQCWLNAGAPNN